MKISNTKVIMNFCDFLERNHHYEESFRVYEQALSIFAWPHVYDIWIIYLNKFVERYKGDKLERARDLFEQVLSSATKDVSIF